MSISNLQTTYLFDNECSSIRIHNNLSENYNGELEAEAGKINPADANLVLVCYTRYDYTGPTYTIIQSPSSHKEYSSLINLDNRLSSFKLFIAPSQKEK